LYSYNNKITTFYAIARYDHASCVEDAIGAMVVDNTSLFLLFVGDDVGDGQMTSSSSSSSSSTSDWLQGRQDLQNLFC
jgi:hypothetical protein